MISVKNNVFASLFNNKNNVLRIYKELHPEAEDLKPEDISVQKTDRNIFGFIVKGKHAVLIAAQNKWNPNIALLMMFNYTEMLSKYIDETAQSVFSNAKINTPKPEFYVVYSGDEAVSDNVSLSDCFSPGNGSTLCLKAPIISEADDTILGQYVGFCRTYDEQIKLHGSGTDAVRETYRICAEKGYLTDFPEIAEKGE